MEIQVGLSPSQLKKLIDSLFELKTPISLSPTSFIGS